jgi:glycyl-tRNA synthetase beta chain
METHQKSFGVEGEDGALKPYFLTVLNMTPPDAEIVRRGWERVLRARLEDARFFWKTDLASNFDAWRAELDSVTFLAPLGSMGDKTRRLADLCAWLAEEAARTGGEALDPALAARAGLLSKADLVSGMVGEFDTLQGIMGGIYAEKKGENGSVSAALAGQYLPAGPDSPLPAAMSGAILSMADKADTLAGCFGLGMMPTGAADPYALRRAALGIARIMLERKLRFDVRALFARALALYGERKWKFAPEETLAKLCEFFAGRVKNMLLGRMDATGLAAAVGKSSSRTDGDSSDGPARTQGASGGAASRPGADTLPGGGADTLLVEAVTAADALDVWAAARRLEALAAMSRRSDFDQAVQTFKRVANIVRKQAQAPAGAWQADLLREEAERRLAGAVEDFAARFAELARADDYPALFGLLAAIRPAVDGFFEGVMVMCDDPALRDNRLRLLGALLAPLSRLADFSALQR